MSGQLTGKIDVLDLIIKVLMEHEDRIDDLVERLEKVVDEIEKSRGLRRK